MHLPPTIAEVALGEADADALALELADAAALDLGVEKTPAIAAAPKPTASTITAATMLTAHCRSRLTRSARRSMRRW